MKTLPLPRRAVALAACALCLPAAQAQTEAAPTLSEVRVSRGEFSSRNVQVGAASV